MNHIERLFSHYVVKKKGKYLECGSEQFVKRSEEHSKWSIDDKKYAIWWAKHLNAKLVPVYYRTTFKTLSKK